jgi:alkylation response protein AidB-like acyl-CoA dehydrogenase
VEFRFTEAQEKFRREVKDFFEKELGADWILGGFHFEEEAETDEQWAVHQAMQRKLGEKGWLSLSWPREYGGQGASRIEYTILREEMAYYGAPGMDPISYGMVVPTLSEHGTEAQKRRHLPPLARGETVWCEGFSEPDAGSDLASLKARAVEEGDCFVVNGQKCWTTFGHRADWGICLFRTDPAAARQRGISMFLVDMNAPGITRSRVYNLMKVPGWAEVFFDQVRIPKENMIGEKNRGWQVAATVLNHERTGIGWAGACRRNIDRLVQYVKESEHLALDPLVRHKLASLEIETRLARLFCYYVEWMREKGLDPVWESSLAKGFAGDVSVRIAEAGMQIAGLYGQLDKGSRWAPLDGAIEQAYLSYPSWTIAAGSPEIQKNIIATIGLGLPR